jgi:hypothetical protein
VRRSTVRLWLAALIGVAVLAVSGCTENTSNQALTTSPKSETSTTAEGFGEKEPPGSLSHAEDTQFCEKHHCIANFPNGHGVVVECSDGEWSHSGGSSGACADHGGVAGGQSSHGGSGGSSGESSAPEHSGGAKEGPGSPSHAEDAQFCSTHTCIPNFPDGSGIVVECNDGQWSHSGGLSGACSHHGGESASSASTGRPGESESPSSASQSSEAVDTLNKYWSSVRDHGFATAYGYLAPGAAGKSESEFIASEEEAGIKNAQFHGTVTHESGSAASVSVQSLITEDAQFGCRSWSGTYTLVQESGVWQIQRAALTPHSC